MASDAAFGADPDQPVDGETFAGGRAHRFLDHGKVYRVSRQCRRKFRRRGADQRNLNLRIGFGIGLQHRRKHGANQIIRHAEPHLTRDRAGRHLGPYLVIQGEQALALAEQSLTGTGQPQTAPVALEQAAAENLLQTLDLLADSALRQMQRVGRRRHAGLVGDGDESPDQSRV